MTPANEVPEFVGQKRGAKLAICNLQNTPIDHLSDLRIHSKTDELMLRVMEKLNLPIPPFVLHRRLLIKTDTAGKERNQLTVLGVDVDRTPVTFLKSVRLDYNRRVARSEPFVIDFRGTLDHGTILKLELEFMGHYCEPNLELSHVINHEGSLYLLGYSPYTGVCKITKQDNTTAGEEPRDNAEKAEDSVLLSTAPDGLPDNIRRTRAANILPPITA